jgi:hypothetical protein
MFDDCELVLGPAIKQIYLIVFHLFSNIVMLNFDMFCFQMINHILCHLDGTLVVIV